MSSFEVDAAMPAPTEITVLQLARLVGLPGAPAIVDVRKDEEFKSDPRLVPTARRHSCPGGTEWCRRYGGQPIVVACQTGRTRSQATAAQLRHEGLDAKTLEGGHEAWCEARHLSYVRRGYHRLTTRDAQYG